MRQEKPQTDWSVVRLKNRYGWETWAVYRDALYLNKSGHWVRPLEAAEFATEQEAIDFGKLHEAQANPNAAETQAFPAGRWTTKDSTKRMK